ncbi:MAG: hemerythrin [Candidatus Eremiobacteraeota bacterium]|nr:hemerythrin [Candidatus Eremiobacteraeota bacterium]
MNIKETVSRVFGKGGDGEEASAPDALELIRSDHREVDALFAKALGDDTPSAQRRRAIDQIVEALTVHARMEEVLFYPALRKAGGADERNSVLEAAEEHGLVKDLIAKIERSQGRDETLTAKVTVLKELVHHHVQEEEGTIFDEARRVLGKERLEKLGAEMQRFKERAQRGEEGGRSAASGKKSSAKRSAAKKPAAKTAARKTPSRKTAARKTSAKRKTR